MSIQEGRNDLKGHTVSTALIESESANERMKLNKGERESMEKQGDRLQAGRCNPHAYEVAIRERGALCGTRGTSVPVPAHTKEAEGLSTLSIPKDQPGLLQIGQSQSHRLI